MTATVEPDAPDGSDLEVGLPAAVLWDMDGTLLDTEPYWIASERDLVEEFGNEWPDHHAHAVVGFDLLDTAAYLQEHGGVELDRHTIVERLLDGVIARLHRRIPWRPGARELLAQLNQAGVPCGLVTMSWRRFVDPVLAALPPGTFAATVTGDELPEGTGKPHPEPYLRGAAAVGAEPSACLVIEDSPTGVRSALTAGCPVVGVPNVRDLDPQPGLVIVDSLSDVDLDDLPELARLAEEGPGPEPRRRLELAPRTWAYVVLALITIVVVALVASRGGDDDQPTSVALPPGAVPIDVWAPYWTLGDTLPEADLRFGEIRELSPFWFTAASATEIVVNANASADLTNDFVDRIGDSTARLVPSINDELPAGEMAAIISDPTTRQRHIDTIVAFADELDAAGIDLDYERFAFSDGRDTWEATRPQWVVFVRDLAAALHDDGRTLTVSIPPVYDVATTGDRGYWVYDHGAIAEYVDAIRIMAYDFSFESPGPIAPLDWVQQSIDGVSLAVPDEHHDKLVLGIPSYGSNWVVSTLGDCPGTAEGRTNVTARTVGDLAVRRGGVPAYDEVTGEWSFEYSLTVDDGVTSCVQNRRVHWVDAEGAAARVELARRAGWGGVSLWALGYEDDAVWDAVVTASRRPLTAAPSG